MQPIQLFALASRQAEWLSVRQAVVSENIANANTPKYLAKDVASFSSVLQQTAASGGMARTNPAHFTGNDLNDSSSPVDIIKSPVSRDIGVQVSGNSVNLTDELTKQGEIKRQYDLNTALVKSFDHMMTSVVKR